MTQDENKIYQIIYTGEDESDKNTKPPIEWTVGELRNAVVNSKSINHYYNTVDGAFDVINDTNHKNLSGERWHKCNKICEKNDINDEIYASNRGRIKIKKDGEEFICILYDKQDTDNPINKKVFADLCKKRKAVGYLIIENPITKKFFKLKSKNNDDYLCVYHMVADAWLVDKYEPGMEIHHITNDGYDNRPENLILVSATEHEKIHSGNYGKEDNEYEPGKYDKK